MSQSKLPQLPAPIRQRIQFGWEKTQDYSRNGWVRLGFMGLLIFLLSQREFSFHFSMGEQSAQSSQTMNSSLAPTAILASQKEAPQAEAVPASAKTPALDKPWWEQIRAKSKDIKQNLNLANAATAVGAALSAEEQKKAAQYSNLGFVLNPTYAKRHGIPQKIVQAKLAVCKDYINQYLKTAQEEAELFNIPVSITLAQGLLESNAGHSRLAKNDNNHFGIKCRAKCIGCRCANYTDDSKYDMFRIFETPWRSFREHSKLLSGRRYKALTKLDRSNYKDWAHGLKKAGYATDPKYAEKLIGIIEFFGLDAYDK